MILSRLQCHIIKNTKEKKVARKDPSPKCATETETQDNKEKKDKENNKGADKKPVKKSEEEAETSDKKKVEEVEQNTCSDICKDLTHGRVNINS